MIKSKAVNIAITLLVSLWVVVGFTIGMMNVYEHKKNCIQQEGWLKGWLWCSTESRYSFLQDITSGFLWPLTIGRDEVRAPALPPAKEQKDTDAASNSPMPVVYACLFIALNEQKQEDIQALTTFIKFLEDIETPHNKIKEKYISDGSKLSEEIDMSGKTDAYYMKFCREPIKNIRATLMSK